MAKEKKEEVAETQGTEEETNETSEFKEFSETITAKVEDVSRILAQFGTEIGEDRKQRETLSGEIGSIKEFIENNAQNKEESDFDPYDKAAREKEILGLVENIKPTNGEKYLTEKGFEKVFTERFTNVLSVAAKNASVTKEFGLSEEEMAAVVNDSTESGLSVREIAFDKYAERKFKTKEFAETLSKELHNNDTTPPMDTALETSFDKTGIPSDPEEFKKWYAEQEKIAPGTAKQKMIEAEKLAPG